jgi:hypothetical protein
MTIDWGAVQTAEDKAQAKREADADAERSKARKYLADTDWYVVRYTETGKPVPESIARTRESARKILQ